MAHNSSLNIVIICNNVALSWFRSYLQHDGTVPTCANQIKGFHFLRLYRIKWAICQYRCWNIDINDKLTLPPPHLNRNTSGYIQYKSYANAYITFKEILLICHEIMFISVNWHWINKYCNDPPSTACTITSNQLEWNALVFVLHTIHNNIADSVRLTQENLRPVYETDIHIFFDISKYS